MLVLGTASGRPEAVGGIYASVRKTPTMDAYEKLEKIGEGVSVRCTPRAKASNISLRSVKAH